MAGKQKKVQLSLSPRLESAIRVFLSDQGMAKKGGLSDFFADLARERLSAWIEERAAQAGRAEELTPEKIAAAVDRMLNDEAAKEQAGKPEPTATRRGRGPFKDDELAALTHSVTTWGASKS